LLIAYRHTAIGHWNGSGWVTGHSSAPQRGSGRVGSEKVTLQLLVRSILSFSYSKLV